MNFIAYQLQGFVFFFFFVNLVGINLLLGAMNKPGKRKSKDCFTDTKGRETKFKEFNLFRIKSKSIKRP